MERSVQRAPISVGRFATAGGGGDGAGGSQGGGGAGSRPPPTGGSADGGGGVSSCAGTSRVTTSDEESSLTKSSTVASMAEMARDGSCNLSKPKDASFRHVYLSSPVLLLSFRGSFFISCGE